jgi:hypothetical protein
MSLLADTALRFWDNLISRPTGPLAFRFYLQPAMAILLAVRDGRRDAALGRSPYLWTMIMLPDKRWGRLREGFDAVTRVLLLGSAMDALYQVLVLRSFRPLELVTIVLLLAFAPYLLARGPAGRLARWWRGHSRHTLST